MGLHQFAAVKLLHDSTYDPEKHKEMVCEIIDNSIKRDMLRGKWYLPACFPSWNCAFWDDLKVCKNCLAFCTSCFCLALSHLCSEASISIILGNARPAASVSRKASRDLLAMKSTADSQYSFRAQYATSASRKGYPWASRLPRFSFWKNQNKKEMIFTPLIHIYEKKRRNN